MTQLATRLDAQGELRHLRMDATLSIYMITNPRAGTLVGADGCPGGWLCVVDRGSTISATVVQTIREALDRFSPELLTVDIPIGLPDAGSRECDLEARKLLRKPRSNSVFAAPIRAVLDSATYADANVRHRAADGRGISKQAFAILPKIREVDALLAASPGLQGVVHEVHPEVCFAEWNGGQAMQYAKSTAVGRTEREALIDAKWPRMRGGLMSQLVRERWAPDDLNDALAALWTAHRIRAGQAGAIPARPPVDRMGLRMEMWA